MYFDIIPRNVDDYLNHLKNFEALSKEDKFNNPAWHIHAGKPPKLEQKVNYSLLLNLASVCNSEDKTVLWYFISRYLPNITPESSPFLDKLVEYSINYYRDFIKPFKKYREATEIEVGALKDLAVALEALGPRTDSEKIQAEIYRIGKFHFSDNLRAGKIMF